MMRSMVPRIYKDGETNTYIKLIYKNYFMGRKLFYSKQGYKYWIMYQNSYSGKTLICWLLTEKIS